MSILATAKCHWNTSLLTPSALLLLACYHVAGLGHPRTPAPAVVTGAVGRRVDDFLTRMSGFGYSGNILLVVHDTVALRRGYSWANRASALPYSGETVFDIGSLAKPFTAVAVLKLAAAGRLTLQDTIGKWLSGVPSDKRSVTIDELLSHRSGIVADFPFRDPSTLYEDVPRDVAVRRILRAPLAFPAGSRASYSNGGFILLAAIVERVSQVPFRQYMHDSIFAPAGLRNTGFWGDHRFASASVASGYDEYGTLVHDPLARSDSTWQDLGSGEMLSTLDDLYRFADALSTYRLLPRQWVDSMWTVHGRLGSRNGDYGYGWFIQQTPRGTTLLQHGGDYLGTGADLEWYRDDRVVMITSTNVRNDFYPTRNRTDRVVPRVVFGGNVAPPPAWVSDSALLAAALGEYSVPGGSLLIHTQGGRFFVGANGQGAADLLVPDGDAVRSRRHMLTDTVQAMLNALVSGNTKPLSALSGGNEDFVKAVVDEIHGLGRGPLLSARVIGTFPSGLPRGSPPDYETTLVRLRFQNRDTAYAIRWANGTIDGTDTPAFVWAADMPLRGDGKGGIVGWNIISGAGVTGTLERAPREINGLSLRIKGGVIHAPRVARDSVARRG